MNRNRLIALFGVILLVLVLLVWGLSAASKSRAEYEASLPTPTPTRAPAEHVQVKGGQIFLNDDEVKAILLDRYGLEVTSEYMGSFDMVAPGVDYTGVDALWPGSAAAYADFGVNHPGLEKDHATVFRTLLMPFLRTQYLDEALRSGIVKKDGKSYVMDLENVVCGMLVEATWGDLGAPGIPGYVKLGGSAPESSGGGRETLLLQAGYITTGKLPRDVRINDLDAPVECNGEPFDMTMRDALAKIWEVNGQQADSSPENWTDFVQIPYPWSISSESLFIGGYNKAADKEAFLKQFVGVYPTYTLSTDHVLVALTPNGLKLLDAFRTDADLQRIGWEKYGMRIGIEGVGQTPGGTDISWFKEITPVMNESRPEVSSEVKAIVNP